MLRVYNKTFGRANGGESCVKGIIIGNHMAVKPTQPPQGIETMSFAYQAIGWIEETSDFDLNVIESRLREYFPEASVSRDSSEITRANGSNLSKQVE